MMMMSVYLSVCSHNSKLHQTPPIFARLHVAVARSSSGRVVIRYVGLLPVLWMVHVFTQWPYGASCTRTPEWR